MVVMQRFNKRNGTWVKMEVTSKGSKILNVKEREPMKPFKGIKRMKMRK